MRALLAACGCTVSTAGRRAVTRPFLAGGRCAAGRAYSSPERWLFRPWPVWRAPAVAGCRRRATFRAVQQPDLSGNGGVYPGEWAKSTSETLFRTSELAGLGLNGRFGPFPEQPLWAFVDGRRELSPKRPTGAVGGMYSRESAKWAKPTRTGCPRRRNEAHHFEESGRGPVFVEQAAEDRV